MSKRKRLIIWLFATVAVWIAVFAVFFSLLSGTEVSYLVNITLAASLSVLGLSVLYMWVRERMEYVEKLSTELKDYRRVTEEKSYTFHIIDSRKEIRILNKNGDATLMFTFRCQNTSDKTLNHININIQHDGNLIEDSIECSIKGKKTEPKDLEQLVTCYLKTKKEIPSMPYTLTFKIPIDENGIKPTEKFEYGYSYTANRMFPRVTEENQEYTGTLILHPTSRITVSVEAPEHYLFLNKSNIRVFDRDKHEHGKEETRIMSESPPLLINDKKTCLWIATNPLLATTYRLYFTVEAMIDKL